MAENHSTHQTITQEIRDELLRNLNRLNSLIDLAAANVPNDTDCDKVEALIHSAQHITGDLYSTLDRLHDLAESEAAQ